MSLLLKKFNCYIVLVLFFKPCFNLWAYFIFRESWQVCFFDFLFFWRQIAFSIFQNTWIIESKLSLSERVLIGTLSFARFQTFDHFLFTINSFPYIVIILVIILHR